MTQRAIKLCAILGLSAVAAATAAHADRYAVKGDRSSVTHVLRANGFVSWREIERDDGHWEVEDARHRSGRVYDLYIAGGRIVHRERDWD